MRIESHFIFRGLWRVIGQSCAAALFARPMQIVCNCHRFAQCQRHNNVRQNNHHDHSENSEKIHFSPWTGHSRVGDRRPDVRPISDPFRHALAKRLAIARKTTMVSREPRMAAEMLIGLMAFTERRFSFFRK